MTTTPVPTTIWGAGMRSLFLVVGLLLIPPGAADAQVNLQIGLPGVQFGINQQAYPQMVRVPGYPVYYAPNGNSNYFFYDGMYWVFQGDSWYASSWYNGPWAQVSPQGVPVFILRVPVRYYHQPPVYFQGLRADAPPRWGEHWGQEWQQQNRGWDRWDRKGAPRPAPLPVYQSRYDGDRYPHGYQQQALQVTQYKYRPKDARVKQAYKEQGTHGGPPQHGQSARGPDDGGSRGQQDHGKKDRNRDN
jgi:hypothetical protein